QPEHYVQGGRAGERVWLEATVLTLGLQPMTPPFLFMRPELVSRHSGSRHNSRAGHPGWLRCSSLRYSRYPRSSRVAIRAPRSEIRSTTDADRPLVGVDDAQVGRRRDGTVRKSPIGEQLTQRFGLVCRCDVIRL